MKVDTPVYFHKPIDDNITLNITQKNYLVDCLICGRYEMLVDPLLKPFGKPESPKPFFLFRQGSQTEKEELIIHPLGTKPPFEFNSTTIPTCSCLKQQSSCQHSLERKDSKRISFSPTNVAYLIPSPTLSAGSFGEAASADRYDSPRLT